MEKDTLNAVHDSDLQTLLANLGVLESVRDRQAKCKYCRDPVGLDLAALFPEGGDIKFVCPKSDCISALLESRSGTRGRDID